MQAQQLNCIILSLNDLTLVQAALDLLRKGQSLSAVQSGTVAYGPDANGNGPFTSGVTLGPDPVVLFDGFTWDVFLWYVSG